MQGSEHAVYNLRSLPRPHHKLPSSTSPIYALGHLSCNLCGLAVPRCREKSPTYLKPQTQAPILKQEALHITRHQPRTSDPQILNPKSSPTPYIHFPLNRSSKPPENPAGGGASQRRPFDPYKSSQDSPPFKITRI